MELKPIDADLISRAGGATAAQARLLATIDKLARGIARGGLPALTAKAVTVSPTSTTSAFASGTTDWFPYSAGVKDKFDNFTFLRGEWVPRAATFPQNYFVRCYATSAGLGGTAQGTGTAPLVAFWTDAPDFEVVFYGTSSATSGGYRVRCDGEYLTNGGIGFSGSGGTTTFGRIKWGDGTGTYRKPRRYEIEGVGDFALKGLRVPTISKVWSAPLSDALKVIVHGDSFVDGTGSTVGALHNALAAQVGLLLGQPDTAGSGAGGCGFIADNSGAKIPFIDRVQYDIIDKAPDVIIEMGGINDVPFISSDPANEQVAVEEWLNTVQSALPDTLIFMTGPMTPGNPAATTIAARDGKKAACQGRNNVVFIDNLAENWVTGTGRMASPQGDGNADWVTGGTTGSDPTHPGDNGQGYLSQRIVEAIASRLPALRASLD